MYEKHVLSVISKVLEWSYDVKHYLVPNEILFVLCHKSSAMYENSQINKKHLDV